MPPVTSVSVERTKYLLPPGTVASDRQCFTDQRGCCVDQHLVTGVGGCAIGDGVARDWELPETVHLTIRSAIPARSQPYDGGEGEYPRSLLLARQILSRVFPLTRTYLTRASHPWAIMPPGYLNNLTEGWYWYWDLNLSADSGLPMNGANYAFGGITGYPFGWLAWRGNQGGPSGAECGRLKGRIDTGPVRYSPGEGIGPFPGPAWWPGYYCGVSAAYREPDGNWTFVMGASDWIPKYRGITCTISAAPPGPAKPRRVSFRSRPLAGVLKLQFEEVTAPPLYTRQYYRYPGTTYDWPRPMEHGTVYLERPAEGGDWAGETTLWGRPSRFLFCGSHLPINVDFHPFCRDGWGLALQVGDLARIFTEEAPGGTGYPYCYYGPQTLCGGGGAGMLVDPGMSIGTSFDGSPCQNGSAGSPPACTLDPLDAEFDLPLTITADAGVPPRGITPYNSGINDQYPVSNSMPLLFRCRLTEGA